MLAGNSSVKVLLSLTLNLALNLALSLVTLSCRSNSDSRTEAAVQPNTPPPPVVSRGQTAVVQGHFVRAPLQGRIGQGARLPLQGVRPHYELFNDKRLLPNDCVHSGAQWILAPQIEKSDARLIEDDRDLFHHIRPRIAGDFLDPVSSLDPSFASFVAAVVDPGDERTLSSVQTNHILAGRFVGNLRGHFGWLPMFRPMMMNPGCGNGYIWSKQVGAYLHIGVKFIFKSGFDKENHLRRFRGQSPLGSKQNSTEIANVLVNSNVEMEIHVLQGGGHPTQTLEILQRADCSTGQLENCRAAITEAYRSFSEQIQPVVSEQDLGQHIVLGYGATRYR